MSTLPDQVQYYNDNEPLKELHYGYKRKLTDEVEIRIIAECYTCGSVMTDEHEIVTYNNETFCGHDCKEEYIKMIEDGDI